MSQDNPYAAPNATVTQIATAPAPAIADVASGQKLIIYGILLYFAAFILQIAIGPFAALLLLGTLVLGIIGIVRLAAGLGIGVVMRVSLVIAMFIPLVGLIVLVVLNGKATKALRAQGYRVGLLGASR